MGFRAIASFSAALLALLLSGRAEADTSGVFPDIDLVHYRETIGQLPQKQLQHTVSTLTIRVFNSGTVKTDPLWLLAEDANGLMKQDQHVSFPGLAPNGSQTVTLTLRAASPPAQPPLPPAQQYSKWKDDYQARCGVDLRIAMTWRGPEAQAPLNARRAVSVYQGVGSSTAAQEGPDVPICDATQCISIREMTRNIHRRLACKVVGYAFFAGLPPKLRFAAFGKARTVADAPALDFKTTTKMAVASASKVITALAAIRVLAKHNISLDATIGNHLPAGWTVDPTIKSITFRELLAQRSGIKDYGDYRNDYKSVKKFFTQTVDTTKHIGCPSQGGAPADPVNRDGMPCYSNFNTAIFRILLPSIEGTPDDREKLANKYVELVQKNVFEPVGLTNMRCKPPNPNTAAFGYKFPGAKGVDWGDLTQSCGALGWYLTVEDFSKVLASLNAQDGKILTQQQFVDMQRTHLGWDSTRLDDGDLGASPHSGYRFLEKNGFHSESPGEVSTSIAIIGGTPITPGDASAPNIIATLFLNSDISGEPENVAWNVLVDEYMRALKPKP